MYMYVLSIVLVHSKLHVHVYMYVTVRHGASTKVLEGTFKHIHMYMYMYFWIKCLYLCLSSLIQLSAC